MLTAASACEYTHWIISFGEKRNPTLPQNVRLLNHHHGLTLLTFREIFSLVCVFPHRTLSKNSAFAVSMTEQERHAKIVDETHQKVSFLTIKRIRK